MEKICLGVIGYGVRMDMLMDEFYRLPVKAEVTAVADLNPERVKELMKKDGPADVRHSMGIDTVDGAARTCPMNPDKIAFYKDAEEMLEKEKLDGVLIGTSCNSHAHFAKMVLDRQLPLFLEKPVGVTREDLILLKKADSAPHAPVVVSFPLRLTQLARETKRILESGVIGKVEHVQAFNDVPYGFVYFHDWYRDEAIARGLFLQKATHDMDLIHYLTGEKPVKVCAMKSKQIFKGDRPAGLRCSGCDKWEDCMESTYNITKTRSDIPRNDYCCFGVDTGNEDSGSMLVRYESGMHVVYSQNFFARKKAGRRGARLYGYKGTLEYDFSSGKIKIFDHMSDKVTEIEVQQPTNGHGGGDFQLVKNFTDLIRGRTEESLSPLRAGIESACLCISAKESSETEEFREV